MNRIVGQPGLALTLHGAGYFGPDWQLETGESAWRK